ncbi:hypothetical protein [Nocardioides sambongensis]|uniref:hypothetical protein n=1 Tax=Nocardioides sambongensis TaxID=2589074 RepID=UPI001128DCE5|nr:hypothetical protein [Nocardioides sambongensis]
MSPTVDTFRALARSAPWRSRTLHFTYATGTGQKPRQPSYDECWLSRGPALTRLVVRDSAGRRHTLTEPSGPTEAPHSSVAVATDDAGGSPSEDEVAALCRPPTMTFRADGLADPRPDLLRYELDVPMWDNYYFVAALDPVELSHDVRVDRLRADTVAGRPAWRADLTPVEGYDPRCGGGCCELLWSEISWHGEDEGPGTPNYREVPGDIVFPDHYDVALDVQTGIVVRSSPVGGKDAPWLEIDILAVDETMSEGRG